MSNNFIVIVVINKIILVDASTAAIQTFTATFLQ